MEISQQQYNKVMEEYKNELKNNKFVDSSVYAEQVVGMKELERRLFGSNLKQSAWDKLQKQ